MPLLFCVLACRSSSEIGEVRDGGRDAQGMDGARSDGGRRDAGLGGSRDGAQDAPLRPPPDGRWDAGMARPCFDRDGDTICDLHEGAVDMDGDGIPNFDDLDSDGDGVPDAEEAGDADPRTPPVDTDVDGTPDAYDSVIPVLCPKEQVVPTGCTSDILDEEEAGLLYDGLDNDCDGLVDEDNRCNQETLDGGACFAGFPGRRGVGVCADGSRGCIGKDQAWFCAGSVLPTAELCDGLDNDCNGCVDDSWACVEMDPLDGGVAPGDAGAGQKGAAP